MLENRLCPDTKIRKRQPGARRLVMTSKHLRIKGKKKSPNYLSSLSHIVCISWVTYHAASRTFVSIFADPATGLDATTTWHCAAFPWWPGWPIDMWGAWEVFITVPERKCEDNEGNCGVMFWLNIVSSLLRRNHTVNQTLTNSLKKYKLRKTYWIKGNILKS